MYRKCAGMEDVREWLYGCEEMRKNGYGDGSAAGYGNRSGSGHSYAVPMNRGCGSAVGIGSERGTGTASGQGMGTGKTDGTGKSYDLYVTEVERLKQFSFSSFDGMDVYDVDDRHVIITSISGEEAVGFLIRDDLVKVPCRITRSNGEFIISCE